MLRLLPLWGLLRLAAAHGAAQSSKQGALELVLDARGASHFIGPEEDDEAEAEDEGAAARPALIRRQEPSAGWPEDAASPSVWESSGGSLAEFEAPEPEGAAWVPMESLAAEDNPNSSELVQGNGTKQEPNPPQQQGQAEPSTSGQPLPGHEAVPTPAPPIIAEVNITALQEILMAQKEKDSMEVSAACAALLLGTLAFALLLYYLVNVEDQGVAASTWELIARMVSIFVTLSLFMAMKSAWAASMKKEEGKLKQSEQIKEIIVSAVRFVFFFLAVPFVLNWVKGNPKRLAMMTMLGAHLLGFSAVETGNGILGLDYYVKSVPSYMGGLSMMVIGMAVVIGILSYVRAFWKGDSAEGEMWDLACIHSENEGYGLFLGFLISMTIRFVITGKVPPIHGNPEGRTAPQCQKLGMAVGASFVVYFLLAMAKGREKDMNPTPRRVSQMVRMTFAMNFGWCLLYWMQWVWWIKMQPKEPVIVLLSYVLMAITTSVVVAAFILFIDKGADRCGSYAGGCRFLLTPFMLTIAFAWNEVFRNTILNLSQFCLSRDLKNKGPEQANKLSYEWWQCILLLVMVIAICPAWCMCIFAKADSVRPVYPEIYPEDFEERKKQEEEDEENEEGEEVEGNEGENQESTTTPEQMAYMAAQQAQWAAHMQRQQMYGQQPGAMYGAPQPQGQQAMYGAPQPQGQQPTQDGGAPGVDPAMNVTVQQQQQPGQV